MAGRRFPRRGQGPAKPRKPTPAGPSQAPGAGADVNPGAGATALLAPPDPLGLNGYERDYADHLEVRRLAGEIRSWSAHPEKFQLSISVEWDVEAGKSIVRQTFYTPDFRVVLADGSVEFHEVKGGHIRDDAMVKARAFADRHPYPLVIASRKKKSDPWAITRLVGTGENWR